MLFIVKKLFGIAIFYYPFHVNSSSFRSYFNDNTWYHVVLSKFCVKYLVQLCWHSARLLVRAACKKSCCSIWFSLRQVTNLSHSSVDHPDFIVWFSLFYGWFPKQRTGVRVQKRQTRKHEVKDWEGTMLLTCNPYFASSPLVQFLTLSLVNNGKLNCYKIHIIF